MFLFTNMNENGRIFYFLLGKKSLFKMPHFQTIVDKSHTGTQLNYKIINTHYNTCKITQLANYENTYASIKSMFI